MPRPMVGASDKIRISRAGCAGGLGRSGACKGITPVALYVAGPGGVAQGAASNGVLPSAQRRFSTPLTVIPGHASFLRLIASAHQYNLAIMPPPRLSSLPTANKIFVNREGPLRIFENAAFNIPADGVKLLTFYGIGGQGKTALCRQLMQIKQGDPSYRFFRRAELDLHGRPKTDPDLLLVWIRNGFADAGGALPCFDLALAIVWEATRGEQPFRP